MARSNNNNKLKAFVRFDGSGRIIPSSLIVQAFKPKVGNYVEIDAKECCNYTTTTTSTTAAPMTWTYNVQLLSCEDCTVIGSGVFTNSQELIVGEYYINSFGTIKVLILGFVSVVPGSAASNILTSSGATTCEELICPTTTTTTTPAP